MAKAAGDKAGIRRYGHVYVPMDEDLVLVVSILAVVHSWRLMRNWGRGVLASLTSELTEEFLRAVAGNAGLTLHVKVLAGKTAHHIVEAIFKALGGLWPNRSNAIRGFRACLQAKEHYKGQRNDEIAIIDYGMGNLHSAAKAWKRSARK